jgi:protein tyrosine phosphatase (PTP) superfamily phosphohydrolase (DUF442 family)
LNVRPNVVDLLPLRGYKYRSAPSMNPVTENIQTSMPARPVRFPIKTAIAGAIAILLVVCFFVAWNNGLRDALIPRNFGIVEPGKLYRSGQMSRWQVGKTLKDNGIKVIVALSAKGGRPADVAAEQQATTDLGIERTVFPLGGDGTGKIDEYADAIAAIDRAKKAGKPVLVHCVAGAQRTGGVIATYEILVEKRPVETAFEQMRKYGHDPRDNPHLIEYLNSHMTELAKMLVARKVIDRVPQPLPILP